MRIHRLQLRGIGPFAGDQELDVDRLTESGLFLLTGPTGAGKTTILDAIVYALYGTVPGARGRGSRGDKGTSDRIVSDLRPVDSQPLVELELTVQARRFRILRVPQHLRPRSRGEGTTVDKGGVSLHEWRDGDWQPRSSKIEEVQREILDLLGMNADQFSQVVLLPQGEFAGFLRATDVERRAILSRLFRVDRYEAAEKWLEERARTSRQAVEAAEQEVAATLQHLGGALGVDLSASGPADTGVGAATAWVVAQHEAVQETHAAAVAAHEAAQAAAHAADAQVARAAAVQQRAEDRTLRATELHEREEQLARAREWIAAQEGADVAADERRWPSAAEAAQAIATRLRDRLGDAARVTGLQQTASAATTAAAAAATRAEQLATRIGELRAASETVQAEAQRAQAAPEHLASLRRDHERLVAAHEAAASVAALRVALERAQANATERSEGVDRSRAALHRAHGEATQVDHDMRAEVLQRHAAYLDAREARLSAMAAELAHELEDGAPCPVCGATDHPAPASHGASGDLRAAEAAAEASHSVARKRSEATAQAVALLAQARETLDPDGLAASPAPAPAHQPAPAAQDLDAYLGRARRVADEAHQAAGQARDAAHEVQLAQGRLEAAEREAGTEPPTPEAVQAAAARVGEAEQAAAHAAQAQAQLDALGAQLATSEQEHQHALAETAAQRERAAADERAAAELTSTLEQLSAPHPTLAAAVEAADTRVRGLLKASEVVQARDRAAEEVARAGATLAEAALADPAAAGEPEDPQARLAARRTTAAALGETVSERFGARQQSEQHLAALGRAASSLRATGERLGPLAAEAETIQRLDQTVRGQGDNRRRISLTTYVLAARLEEVAAAATVHLQRMSSNRYSLLHHDERFGNAQAGLGLRVLDGHSGEERETATLSGGEAFYASLALALGLADVVQREAGGRPLETLLVDEGFGSLDADTLEDVLGELDDLRAKGRAIGVVSHVPALAERIPAQLRVTPGPTGSSAQVIVGPLALVGLQRLLTGLAGADANDPLD